MRTSDQIKALLGPDGLTRIENAVARAEAGTCGQIATHIAWQSDSYPEAPWKGAALGAAAACLGLFLADWSHPLWQSLSRLLAAVLGGCALGAMTGGFVPALRRLLTGSHRLAAMAHRRAEEVFLHHELFKTERRTGILIFVSLFERRAVVVADSGINAKVDPEDWDRAVSRVIESAQGAKLVEGIVQSLTHCHELLLKAGFTAEAGQRNELSDKPLFDGEGA